MSEIYALCDPRTGEVRYIGKANDSIKRYESHMREKRRAYPVYAWRDKLASIGLKPELKILERCCEDWRASEIALIAKYREAGARLLNVADGGDQPSCTKEQRSKNAQKLNAKKHSDPILSRIHQIRLQVVPLLKSGQMSKEAKEAFKHCADARPDLFGMWSKYL